jgi:hypothetical protein
VTSNATIEALAALFASLGQRAQDKFLSKVGAARPEVTVVDYSTMTVRHGIRHYLQANGPTYYRDLPEIIGCKLSTVVTTLSSRPEFVSDNKGMWVGRY